MFVGKVKVHGEQSWRLDNVEILVNKYLTKWETIEATGPSPSNTEIVIKESGRPNK